MRLQEITAQLGLETCLEFNPRLIIPEERIRAFCLENKCGNYGNNYTCPPYAGSIAEIREKLESFQHGLLLRYSKYIDVKGNKGGVIKTRMDFHNIVLHMEEILKACGIDRMWGMIGGNCGLCAICKARSGKPCLYPGKARISMEAAAIDVLGLLERLNLDNRFHTDKITWTGCILY